MSNFRGRTRGWLWAVSMAALVVALTVGLASAHTAQLQVAATGTPAAAAAGTAAPTSAAAAVTAAPTGVTGAATAVPGAAPGQGLAPARLSANATVFATGLNNPRGLKFGPDGNLYVAEGGTGGTQSTVGACDQVPAPIGPYTGSPTGSRISRIDANGARTTFADGFPSSMTAAGGGGFVSGVADVAFISNTLYAITAGAGCSHGVANTANGIYRVGATGRITRTVDLTNFQKTHPTAVIAPDDFEPDGTWYSLAAVDGLLYAVEPNHGELDSITPGGIVTRLTDISDTQGHIVPTALAYYDGNFYVGNLGDFPAVAESRVLRIDRYGNAHFISGDLGPLLGLAIDRLGQLYALETSAPVTDTTSGAPVVPGTGRVIWLDDKAGRWVPVATGLTFPTAMTFGPDGYLYISNYGYGVPPQGSGQIVRVDVTKAP